MKDFNPSIGDLHNQDLVLYEVISGSVAYGLNTQDSDEDIRGYYHVPINFRNGLGKVADQVNDQKNDVVFYNLKRAFDLLMTANPNQIELLWIPKDCVRIYNKEVMDELIANRDLFISKAAYYSHFQYAKSQISRAKGRNKWVNNPKPKDPPKKEDFCWIISLGQYLYCINALENFDVQPSVMPVRPSELKNIDLSKYNCAKLEHVENIYRLYFYGDEAKGVFRGNSCQIVCESIPKEDEWNRLEHLLIYNEQTYERAHKDWKEYWKWMANRNEKRWIDQEKGILDFDAKNMSHCLRLMLSSKNILEHGYPIVRFDGENQKLLMDIKSGKVEYKKIMEMVESLQKEIETLVEKTKIPEEVDFEAINKLYIHLNQLAQKSVT